MFLNAILGIFTGFFLLFAVCQFFIPIKDIMKYYPGIEKLAIFFSCLFLLGISLTGHFHLIREGHFEKVQPMVITCIAGMIMVLVTYFRIHCHRKKTAIPT